MSCGWPPQCIGAAACGPHACTCTPRKRARKEENRPLAELARLLRSYGWKVVPPDKTGDTHGGPCPTCGHERTPNARDHALRIGAEEDVTAESLAAATDGTIPSARNTLSELVQQGLMRRVGRGRYRAC